MSSGRSSAARDYSSINNVALTLGALTLLLSHGSLGQDIKFPDESTEVLQRVGANVPPRPLDCPVNMTAIQEANETFCECIAGNLYYPELDRCYLQYTRGPCDEGEHFILPRNSSIAKCVRNPCPKEWSIPFKGSCHDLLRTGGPCKSDETLAIPETAFEPQCMRIVPVHYQIITAPPKMCGPGTRRASHGKCRKIIP